MPDARNRGDGLAYTPEAAEALAAEVEKLRAWKEQAMSVMEGLQDLGRALGLPLGAQITGGQACEAVERLHEQRDWAMKRADNWKAEAERHRAALERIVALDYRGNEPAEQRIAREALSASGERG